MSDLNGDERTSDGEEAHVLAQLLSGLSLEAGRDRHDLLWLVKNMDELVRLKSKLLSTKKYISRDSRDLISHVLLFYRRHCPTDDMSKVEDELEALGGSTKRALDKNIRKRLHDRISCVCNQFASDFAGFYPENDDERFDVMTDSENIIPKYWFQLCDMGIVNCHVRLQSRKFVLTGMTDAEAFFSAVKSQWKFEHPEIYFVYTGGASMPEGKAEAATHVTAGSSLEIMGDLVEGYDLNGTVGGLMFDADAERMHVVTAGHCATKRKTSSSTAAECVKKSACDDTDPLADESSAGPTSTAAECVKSSACDDTDPLADESSAGPTPTAAECVKSSDYELVITDNYFDCAVLPLCPRNEETLHCANPWYMDDDVNANEEYYQALTRSTRQSFDTDIHSITPGDDHPFLSAELLHPGTVIVKIGSTTGITMGQFIGVKNVNYKEGSKSFQVVGAIVVQWEPGQRFSSGGDSGSVYYAKLGSFTFPIAIHRAQVIYDTPNYLVGGPPLQQVVSIGTPLLKVVKKFKEQIDVCDLIWFKNKNIP